MKTCSVGFLSNLPLILLSSAFGLLSACGSEQDFDTSPDPFTLSPVSNAPPDAWVDFGPFVIEGINTPVNVSFDHGEVSIGYHHPYFQEPITIKPGQVLHYRLKSSELPGGTVTSWLHVGDLQRNTWIKSETDDIDGDNIPDSLDKDNDNDGVLNVDDPAPKDATITKVLRWVTPAAGLRTHLFEDNEFEDFEAPLVGDVNHDGYKDVVGLLENKLVWRKGLGNGKFAPSAEVFDQVSAGIRFLTRFQISDIDDDGKLEIFGFAFKDPAIIRFVGEEDVQVEIIKNISAQFLLAIDGSYYLRGGNTLRALNDASLSTGLGCQYVDLILKVGDYKGLGYDQLVAPARRSGISIFDQAGKHYNCIFGVDKDLWFKNGNMISSEKYNSLNMVDLDKDGRAEIIISYDGGRESPSVNLGKLQFENREHLFSVIDLQTFDNASPATDGSAKFGPAIVVDADNDGDIDIVQAWNFDGESRLAMYFNQGNGHYGKPEIVNSVVGDHTQLIDVADFNSDGLQDILTRQAWYERKPQYEPWMMPGEQRTLSFEVASDDGKPLTYVVISSHPNWFDIDGKTGLLTVSLPESVTHDQDSVSATVRVSDGASVLQRTIRVHVETAPAD